MIGSRTFSDNRERADTAVKVNGVAYLMTATKTDDGVWVGKCRQLPEWSAKAATVEALEQALCDEVA